MRIGIIVSSSVRGGGEVYLENLYRHLALRGHEPVLIGSLPKWDLACVDTGVEGKWSRHTAALNVLSSAGDRRKLLTSVQKEHRSKPFDIFHAQYKREQILATAPLSRLAPVIWTEHGLLPRGQGSTLLRWVYRRAARAVARVICVSEGVSADVQQAIGTSHKIVVIPNGVDLQGHRVPTPAERQAARTLFGLSPESLVLVVASRLDVVKGIDLAIRSLDYLPSTARLIIAGEGPDRPRLERLSLGRRVTFLGHLASVATVYDASEVLLFPSAAAAGEGFGMSILEAAAHGIPTLTVSGSGMEERVREAGGAVADRDPASIAARIVSLDPAAGYRARSWAERYGLIQWVERHEAIMRDVVAVRGHAE